MKRFVVPVLFLLLVLSYSCKNTATPQSIVDLSADTVRVLAVLGGAQPESVVVVLTSAGGDTIGIADDSIVYEGLALDWLQVEGSGTGNELQLTNRISVSSLLAGTYAATVNVIVDGATNNPQKYTVVLKILQGPSLFVSVDSINGIPNAPDAITQASPVPISIRMRVASLADSADTTKTVALTTGDGQSKQWTGRQIPIDTDFRFGSWWERSGLCTVKVAATTARGCVSDTSIVCRVLTKDEYHTALAKRMLGR